MLRIHSLPGTLTIRCALAVFALAASAPAADSSAKPLSTNSAALGTGKTIVWLAAPGTGKTIVRLAAAGDGGVRVSPSLIPGVSTPFSLDAVGDPSIFNGVSGKGFQINVPDWARRLDFRVTASPSVDLSLFVRYGNDVGLNSDLTAATDYSAEGLTGNVSLRITPCSLPGLRGGPYFIAFGLLTTQTAVTGTITATIDGPASPEPCIPLSSGTPLSFSFDPQPAGTLLAGDSSYRIPVPTGATQLTVNLVTATPGVNLDLYVRFGSNIDRSTTGAIVADYRGEGPTGNERIQVTPASSPPLATGGNYFIALFVGSTTGAVITGTLTVTVQGGGGGGAYALSRIEVTRTYGPGVPAPSVSQPAGKQVLGPDRRSFDLGWNFQWPDPAVGPNVNTASSTTTLTQAPAIVAVGSQVTFAASVNGAWNTTGYQNPHDHTIALTGVAGTNQFSVGGNPSSAQSGSFTSSNTITVPQADANQQLSVTLNATILFGAGWQTDPSAAGATMEIRLVYSAGTASGCTYSISPAAQSFFSTGGTATVSVTTAVGCVWAATSNAPWITIPSGASGTGNGAVSYSVAANTATSSRSGTLTIAGQTYTVTQSGQATTPTIDVSTTSLTFNAQFGANPPPQSFAVRNSGPGTLNYQLSTNQRWLVVTPTSGSSRGDTATIAVSVDILGNPAAFTGAGTFNAQITLTPSAGSGLSPAPSPAQAAPTVVGVQLILTAQPGPTPAINSAGVVNAASFQNPALPGGAIARGSIFSLFGTAVGPATLAQASSFPLQAVLAGVSVKVSQGSTSVDAIPLAVVGTQINAILPSNTPTGQVQVTVTVNGRASAPVTVQVVGSSLGLFTANQNGMGPGVFTNFNSQTDQPANSPLRPARPGQLVIAWGTGLGPITAPDNQSPPAGTLPASVDILVGNKAVTDKQYSGRSPCCAGLDQIVFRVPGDAPQGCFVPVLIRVNGTPANVATMAIDPQGAACSDPANPLSRFTVQGGKLGSVELLRFNARLQLDPTGGFTNVAADFGSATFSQQTGGPFGFDPLSSLPPVGSCSVFSAAGINVSGLLSGQIANVPSSGRSLDAGLGLSVTGPKGTRTIPAFTGATGNRYSALLGGSLPVPGPPSLPLFLDPGSYTVTGSGGPEVGPFSVTIPVAGSVTWTNEQQLGLIDRSQGATLTWSGGDPSSQALLILGGNVDNQAKAGAVFVCLAPLDAGRFTVSPTILGSLPPSNLQQPSQSVGFLFLGATPTGNLPTFAATGLDAGYGLFAQFIGASAVYK